ncbi:DUF5493 family protein [Sulfuracidifex metallicus]|uniref:Uncharacterized protein n=1 Tax=Sulfuracidifex metallicus DSM 6482 = JCM 9184 TaxID=523847 RepID=A0A6A9QQE2_SULME|nr:DUF5493 family protein [Sulfuracidifex metallicus]MUN29978.1 hypothetical protein [Sulfuracidifex metallicus DSM 6482 = JCM 9184]WOE51640.1 DUF5493 family protein [Sulfuracidifex metallicus DSM 6482 = JCM 9184]
MTVVGDSVYIIGILVPLITAFFRNVLAHAVGIVFGTVGMLVFFGGFTDVAIGSASFIFAILPLMLTLINVGMMVQWASEDRW